MSDSHTENKFSEENIQLRYNQEIVTFCGSKMFYFPIEHSNIKRVENL